MARNHRSKTVTAKMKFSELAAQWLLSVSHGIKESTLAHYHYTLERYLLPVFGGDSLSALDEQRLEQGILQVISAANGSHKPLGTSSSRECLTMLRRICKYAAHLHLMRSMEIFVKLPRMEHALSQSPSLPRNRRSCVTCFGRSDAAQSRVTSADAAWPAHRGSMRFAVGRF